MVCFSPERFGVQLTFPALALPRSRLVRTNVNAVRSTFVSEIYDFFFFGGGGDWGYVTGRSMCGKLHVL